MPPRKSNLTEKTAKRISDIILAEKRYSPGERIPSEYEIAQELGVSRLTVREAIKILTANGILYIKRGVGTFVAEEAKGGVPLYGIFFTRDKQQMIMESLETRRIIEPEIVMLAARRAEKEDIEEMYSQAEQCRKRLLNGEEVYENDRGFHIAVAKAAHNDILYGIMTNLEFTLEEAQMALTLEKNSKMVFDREIMEMHFEIVRFIEEEDAVGASLVMRHHLNSHYIYLGCGKNKLEEWK